MGKKGTKAERRLVEMFMPQGSPCLIHVFVLMKHSRKRRRRSDVIERRRFWKGKLLIKKKKAPKIVVINL